MGWDGGVVTSSKGFIEDSDLDSNKELNCGMGGLTQSKYEQCKARTNGDILVN